MRIPAAGALCAAALALFGAVRAEGEDPQQRDAPRPAPVGGAKLAAGEFEDALPPRRDEVHAALQRGLAFLAAQQAAHQDGTFPRLEGRQHVPVALAALGALAFMASGSTPDRGPWGAQVSAAVDYLLSKSDPSLSPMRGYVALSRSDEFGMHGHGYATLALAQAFTMAPSSARGARVAAVLPDAVRVIERSQTVEGGWYYQPDAGVLHENSVTVVQLQALRAARDCGVLVDSTVIAKAVEYIGRCQNEKGAFRYSLDPLSHPSIALTAAGLSTLQSAGRYEGPEVERATRELVRALIDRDGELDSGGADFRDYERLYVALALWTGRDRRPYERWKELEEPRVLAAQRADGSWGEERFGACYATAMTCLFLALEDELLPLFQR